MPCAARLRSAFLCNDYNADNLPERLAKRNAWLHPLKVECRTTDGAALSARAINEVTFLRDSPQSTKLQICIDGIERLHRYSGDGLWFRRPLAAPPITIRQAGPSCLSIPARLS